VRHARKELWFEVPERRAYLNITPQVEEFVRESGIANGLCLVNPMHITAAVYVNDDERGLLQDIDDWLERLAPHEPVLGPWEQVFYAEFDGRRRKRVLLKAIGE
jgi:thiamine phosphate synthase YjbQ (UPF0047 family)